MKNIYLVFAAILILGVVSCVTEKKMGRGPVQISRSEAKRNRDANQILLKAFQTGDVSKLDGVVSPDFLNHAGQKIGIDSLKAGIANFHSRFKPIRMEVKRQLTDGEFFSDWIRYVGSDSTRVIEGIEMTRYADGKAMEHWFFPGAPTNRM